jgi:hypothetical protein
MMREHNLRYMFQAMYVCQTGFGIWHLTCFESDRSGMYTYFVFKSTYGQEISLFSTSPRIALCPSSLPFNAYQGLFPGVRQLWCQVNHSPPSSTKVNNECSNTTTALIYHHGIGRGKNLLSFTCYNSTLSSQILTYQTVKIQECW